MILQLQRATTALDRTPEKNVTESDDSIQWSTDSVTSNWLRRIRAGDNDAWVRLDWAYRKLVLWWCLKIGLPRKEADDVVQDVFVDVQAQIGTYQNQSFRGWLWTITKRRVTDYWRRQQRQPPLSLDDLHHDVLDGIAAETSGSGSAVDPATKVLFDAVVSFVQREFSPLHWQAFWKVVVEGKRAAEVAEELGITRTVVHNATSRIRRRIREEFGSTINVEPTREEP